MNTMHVRSWQGFVRGTLAVIAPMLAIETLLLWIGAATFSTGFVVGFMSCGWIDVVRRQPWAK